MFTDDDDAVLYDLLNQWDPERSPGDRFYTDLVMAADSVLDVGCGTGMTLHHARALGHRGRLVGLDPHPPSLRRARRRTDIEWLDGRAADAPPGAGFDLAIMTGHAFQCLLTDDDIRDSLAAVRAALRPGGRFVFETRHPQARAWLSWTPGHPVTTTHPTAGPLRVWHSVDSVTPDLVTFTTTTAAPDGTPLHTDRSTLRFLSEPALDTFLTAAGFRTESRYGDWPRTPVTPASREIITVALA
ncbi:methyltransferase domain-containing protein [Streptomyces sp. NPDC008317]|uniref:class I SAM-dependent methyltransferase n=1 Tax=unclassified Streptomyces TaxID=2593676 RepID=UPI0036F097AD